MNPVVATLIVLGIITVGEIVSIHSRAKIPTLLVVMIGFFVLIKSGVLPSNIVEASTFAIVGAVLQPALLVHMGTLIPMKVMKSQYKAVLITLIGLMFSVAFILLIVTPFFGYDTGVAGAGPLTGGLIAYLVTAEALQKAGLAALVAIPVIVLTLQGLVGMPLTSILLRKHGLKVQSSIAGNTMTAATSAAKEIPSAILSKNEPEEVKKKKLIPERYQKSSFVLLFLVFIGGAIAVGLESITGISYSLFGLVIGIIGAYIGFYPTKVLEKANGFSIAMVGLIFIVVNSLVGISLADIVAVLPAVVTLIIVGTIGLIIGGFIGSKIFNWDPAKGISVTLTAMYGFPGDYLICQEVSRSIGKTPEEEEAILNEILPPMLIGGFTSVTVGSVIIASILVQTI